MRTKLTQEPETDCDRDCMHDRHENGGNLASCRVKEGDETHKPRDGRTTWAELFEWDCSGGDTRTRLLV
jgi:hypothetical protein